MILSGKNIATVFSMSLWWLDRLNWRDRYLISLKEPNNRFCGKITYLFFYGALLVSASIQALRLETN